MKLCAASLHLLMSIVWAAPNFNQEAEYDVEYYHGTWSSREVRRTDDDATAMKPTQQPQQQQQQQHQQQNPQDSDDYYYYQDEDLVAPTTSSPMHALINIFKMSPSQKIQAEKIAVSECLFKYFTSHFNGHH